MEIIIIPLETYVVYLTSLLLTFLLSRSLRRSSLLWAPTLMLMRQPRNSLLMRQLFCLRAYPLEASWRPRCSTGGREESFGQGVVDATGCRYTSELSWTGSGETCQLLGAEIEALYTKKSPKKKVSPIELERKSKA